MATYLLKSTTRIKKQKEQKKTQFLFSHDRQSGQKGKVAETKPTSKNKHSLMESGFEVIHQNTCTFTIPAHIKLKP